MQIYKSISIAVLVLLPNFFYVAQLLKVKFTNLQCEEYDRAFSTFKTCILKAVARDTVSLSMHVQMHKVPITNVSVNAQLFLKGNGYRPFLYNNTFDFCNFLKYPNRNMFWKIIYEMAKPYTNINTTCPITEDLIIDQFILKTDMFKLIPFPPDEYMIQLQFAAYNHYKAKIRTYFRIYN